MDTEALPPFPAYKETNMVFLAPVGFYSMRTIKNYIKITSICSCSKTTAETNLKLRLHTFKIPKSE